MRNPLFEPLAALLVIGFLLFAGAGMNAEGPLSVLDGFAFAMVVVTVGVLSFLTDTPRQIRQGLSVAFAKTESTAQECGKAEAMFAHMSVWCYGFAFLSALVEALLIIRNLADVNSIGPSIVRALHGPLYFVFTGVFIFGALRASCRRARLRLAQRED